MEVDMEFLDFQSSFSYLEGIWRMLVRPAEEEMLDFLTGLEITINDLYSRKYPDTEFFNLSFGKVFPKARSSVQSLLAIAERLGIGGTERQFRKSDFHELMMLCANFGDMSAEELKKLNQEKLLWKPYFRSHRELLVAVLMLRSIESLRELLSRAEWGNRRKLLFGESLDELTNGAWDDTSFSGEDEDEEDDENHMPSA